MNRANHQIYHSIDELPLTLTIKEAGDALGISHNTTYALVRSGRLRHVRLGRAFRIPKEALIEYLSAENQG